MSDPWVRVDAVTGGQIVFCTLCGKKVSFRRFMAEDTNYAEAFRLATAFAATHGLSDMHRAALDAFHAPTVEVPPTTREEALLAEIFGTEPVVRTELEQRRGNARVAAESLHRKARNQ